MFLDFAHEVPTATYDDSGREEFGEDEMQVKIAGWDSEWHRFLVNVRSNYDATSTTPVEVRTACGLTVAGAYSTRDPLYSGKLCTGGCFTAYELKLNADLTAAEAEERRLANLPWFGRTKSQRARIRKETAAEAAAEGRRLTTERMKKLMPDGSPSDEGDDK